MYGWLSCVQSCSYNFEVGVKMAWMVCRIVRRGGIHRVLSDADCSEHDERVGKGLGALVVDI